MNNKNDERYTQLSKTKSKCQTRQKCTVVNKARIKVTEGKTQKIKCLQILRKSETRNPKSENQNPKSEIRNPKSEIRNPKSEVRNPKSEIQEQHEEL